MKAHKLIRLSALLIATITLSTCLTKAEATNSYIPELNVYQEGSSPKVQIGVDMANEDVINTSGFENSSEYNLNARGTGFGNQSIVSDVKYNGNKAYKLTDTISGNTGNDLDPAEVGYMTTPYSRVHFNKKFYANNGQYMSLTYKVKVNGGSRSWGSVNFECAVNTYKSRPYLDDSGHEVKFRDAQTFTSFPEYIYVYTDYGKPNLSNNHCQAICSSKTLYKQGLYMYEEAYSRFKWVSWDGGTVPSDYRDTFKAGDNVMTRDWYSAYTSRQHINDGQWHTVSLNCRFPNQVDFFDFSKDGAIAYLRNATDSVMYIDDVKYGYASRIQVIRDNSEVVYDDFGTEFTDSGVVVKPNAPSISSLDTKADKVVFNYSATPKVETHSYTARSLGSTGLNPSNYSSAYTVSLSSTPSRYHVELYKNGSLVINQDTGTSLEYTDVKEGDRLTGGIYTIDSNNQVSSVTPIDYTVKQTAKDLEARYNNHMSSLNISNSINTQDLKTNILNLRTNTNINYSISSITKTDATKYNQGKLNSIVSINNSSKPFSKSIACKPEYQTKDELVQDIKDYINHDGHFSSSEFKLPSKISFSNSKNTNSITNELVKRCKTNQSLGRVRIEYSNSATEFSDGSLVGKIYIDD